MLAVAGERAVRRDLVVEAAGAQVVDELVEVGVRDAVAVAVVDLQRRRLGARRLALGVLQRDQAVGVVLPALMPSVCSAWCISSSAPISAHDIVPQMLIRYLPVGSNRNIS